MQARIPNAMLHLLALLVSDISIYVKAFRRFTFLKSCSLLSSRAVSSKVLLAVRVLTVVFGMGTGVSPGRIATRMVTDYLPSAPAILDL